MALIDEKYYGVKAHLQYNICLTDITILKQFHTQSQIFLFSKTPLGHFLSIRKSLKVPGPLIHHFLLHQCSVSEEDVIGFQFCNDQKLVFSLSDFSLITGLCCGKLPASRNSRCGYKPCNKSLLNKYFPGKSNITREEFISFMETNKQEVDNEDAIKIAKVFIVEYYLKARRPNVFISNEVLSLVHDESFDLFPWGTLSYKDTLSSFDKALHKLKGNTHDPSSRVSYELKGFPVSFVVWIYELINDKIDGGLALRAEKIHVPRMLSWTQSMTPSFDIWATKLANFPKVMFFMFIF